MNTMTFDNVKEQLTNGLAHRAIYRDYTPHAIQAAATIWTRQVEPHELTGDTLTITTPDSGDITLQGTNISKEWNNLNDKQQEQISRGELNTLIWYAKHDKDLNNTVRTLGIYALDGLRIYADSQKLHNQAIQFLAKVEQYSTN